MSLSTQGKGFRLEQLGTRDIHVWLAVPEAIRDRARLDAYRELLSPEELVRYRRFRFERHRHAFLVSHALLRCTLSRYADVAPQAWGFVENEHGRPEIATPARVPPLRFNLSHTEALCACAVTLTRDLGVDVETHTRRRVNLEVADRFFTDEESRALRELAPHEQPGRFLELWTLKEAYIKARGMGLALSLRRFAFRIVDGQPAVNFLEGLEDDPAQWQFELRRLEPAHVLAIAARTPPGQSLELEIQRTVPDPVPTPRGSG